MKEAPFLVTRKMKTFAGRHQNICYWCKMAVRIDVDAHHDMAPTREHVIPKSLKPNGTTSNYVLAHRICNQIRGVMDADAFHRLMNGQHMAKHELWPHLFKRPI